MILGSPPVEARIDLVVVSIASGVEQVILRPASIGFGIEFDHLRRNRIDPVAGDRVVRESRPRAIVLLGCRIVDCRDAREITHDLRGRGHYAEPRQFLADPRAFVTAEIEHPVLDQWTAERGAELILPIRRLRPPAVEEVVRIQLFVAQEFEQGAVDGVRA